MRIPVIFSVLSAAALTACVPLSTYYREGAAVSLVQRDALNCEVKALKDAPVANQTRVTPPRYVPARRSCSSSGACHVTPGYYIPGQTYTVDANQGLRKRVEAQCMADKGYAPVDIPACPDRIVKAAPPAVTSTLPALTPKSCVIKYKNGTYQIVNKS